MGIGGWFSWLKDTRENYELQKSLTKDKGQIAFIDEQIARIDKKLGE